MGVFSDEALLTHRSPDGPSGHAFGVPKDKLRAIRDWPIGAQGCPGFRWRSIRAKLAEALAPLLRRGHRARGNAGPRAVALVDIVDHHRLEFACDVGPAQSAEFLAVDEHRRRRRLAGAGQGDADVGMLGFAGAVDDAAHDRNVERFDAGIARLPARHFNPDEILDRARQFLEGGRGGSAAAGACRDQRHEGAKTHGLQQFLRDLHFQRAIAAGLRRQRNPHGIADVLLQQGIGDTVRISLTPEPGGDRTLEVQVAQELLQTMGFRTFVPLVAACPGCGRTTSTTFQELARSIQDFIRVEMPSWKTRYPGVESLNVAIMGCIVNGPGESKHADIGISLPGTGETPAAPVFVDGKKFRTLRGPNIAGEFKAMVIDYIDQRYGAGASVPASTVTAAE